MKAVNESDNMEAVLYRIYFYTSNSRKEIARILAYDYDHVIQLIKSAFIDPQWVDRFEEYDWGLEAIVCDPSECKEYIKDCDNCLLHCGQWKHSGQCPLIDEEPCDSCTEPMREGFYIEEVDDYTDSDLSFKTIYGTNEFYYINQQGIAYKAPPWSPILAEAWRKSPELGVAMLIIQTVTDHPSLSGAFSPTLIEESWKKVKELFIGHNKEE